MINWAKYASHLRNIFDICLFCKNEYESEIERLSCFLFFDYFVFFFFFFLFCNHFHLDSITHTHRKCKPLLLCKRNVGYVGQLWSMQSTWLYSRHWDITPSGVFNTYLYRWLHIKFSVISFRHCDFYTLQVSITIKIHIIFFCYTVECAKIQWIL